LAACTRRISVISAASRLARAGSRSGSARCAACAWYVDGAIGSTLQIGSTPLSARCSSMKAIMTGTGG